MSRIYRRCRKREHGGDALGERLGISRRYSPQAQRLIRLVAAGLSYDISRERRELLCGLSVSDTTVREIAEETGAMMATWQRTEPVAVQEFCQATSSSRASTRPKSGARSSWASSRNAIARSRRRTVAAARH